MKSHAFRPLYVVLALVALTLLLREFAVPDDFGSHERGYMYGWHRKGNEEEWKQVKVKYQTREYCRGCHQQNYSMIMQTPHAIINCENCHGLAVDHPEDPPKLEVNRTREQCLRCHAKLPSEGSGRAVIRGILNGEHNPDMECVLCHNPHKPGFS
jgi:hypothetical protein